MYLYLVRKHINTRLPVAIITPAVFICMFAASQNKTYLLKHHRPNTHNSLCPQFAFLGCYGHHIRQANTVQIKLSLATNCDKLKDCRPQCSRFRPFVITHFITIASKFCECSGELGYDQQADVSTSLQNFVRSIELSFLISNFSLVLNVLMFLSGVSPASDCYVPTFRNTLFHLHR
jgi:hypothetical protein